MAVALQFPPPGVGESPGEYANRIVAQCESTYRQSEWESKYVTAAKTLPGLHLDHKSFNVSLRYSVLLASHWTTMARI